MLPWTFHCMPSMNHRVTRTRCTFKEQVHFLFPQCHHGREHNCSLHQGTTYSCLTSVNYSLLDLGSLPSVWGRQRPNCTWQRIHGKKLIDKVLFAECLLSGTRQKSGDTRQRKATVTAPIPLTVTLPSPTGTRQRFFIFFKKKIFDFLFFF